VATAMVTHKAVIDQHTRCPVMTTLSKGFDEG
jgi:hypothetical protein